jgi:hypothetical protein
VASAVPAPVPGSDPPVTGSDVEVGGAGVWHLRHPQPRSYPHSPEHRAIS